MFQSLTKDNFNHLLVRFSTAELENLLVKYPYFHQAHILLAKKYQEEDNTRFDEQLQLAALYAQEKELLFDIFREEAKKILPKISAPEAEIGTAEEKQEPPQQITLQDIAPEVVAPMMEEEKATDIHTKEFTGETEKEVVSTDTPSHFDVSTTHTFNEWLHTFTDKQVSAALSTEKIPESEEDQDKELNTLIQSSISADYLHELVEGETHYARGLDRFIEEQKLKHRIEDKTRPVNEYMLAPELVTETMAKIYEMQKKYTKAIKAYELLALKYPEKNDFFAARIIFLKNIT